jgi:hypothetical protein
MSVHGPWADDVFWIRHVRIGRLDVCWNPYGTAWPPQRMKWEPWAEWSDGFHIGPLQLRVRR